jgi:hypothetical protein
VPRDDLRACPDDAHPDGRHPSAHRRDRTHRPTGPGRHGAGTTNARRGRPGPGNPCHESCARRAAPPNPTPGRDVRTTDAPTARHVRRTRRRRTSPADAARTLHLRGRLGAGTTCAHRGRHGIRSRGRRNGRHAAGTSTHPTGRHGSGRWTHPTGSRNHRDGRHGTARRYARQGRHAAGTRSRPGRGPDPKPHHGRRCRLVRREDAHPRRAVRTEAASPRPVGRRADGNRGRPDGDSHRRRHRCATRPRQGALPHRHGAGSQIHDARRSTRPAHARRAGSGRRPPTQAASRVRHPTSRNGSNRRRPRSADRDHHANRTNPGPSRHANRTNGDPGRHATRRNDRNHRCENLRGRRCGQRPGGHADRTTTTHRHVPATPTAAQHRVPGDRTRRRHVVRRRHRDPGPSCESPAPTPVQDPGGRAPSPCHRYGAARRRWHPTNVRPRRVPRSDRPRLRRDGCRLRVLGQGCAPRRCRCSSCDCSPRPDQRSMLSSPGVEARPMVRDHAVTSDTSHRRTRDRAAPRTAGTRRPGPSSRARRRLHRPTTRPPGNGCPTIPIDPKNDSRKARTMTRAPLDGDARQRRETERATPGGVALSE